MCKETRKTWWRRLVTKGAGFASKLPAWWGVSLALASLLASWGTGSARAEQVIVIDIPGIRTTGADRPEKWAPTLIGSDDYARHNLRHKGAFGGNTQGREPGTTTTLEHKSTPSKDLGRLEVVLSDVRVGKNVYVKLDKNAGIFGHLFPKPGEAAWVQKTGDTLSSEIRRIAPNAKVFLNTHSSATIDAAGMKLSNFDEVILSSNRGSQKELNSLVTRFPGTSFTLIAGNRDFAHDLRGGYMSVTAPNLKTVNITNGGLMPWTVHGTVTNPSARVIADVKTVNGIQRVQGTLGQIITTKNLTGFVVPMAPKGPKAFLPSLPGGCTGPDGGPFRLPGGWNRPGGPFGGLDGFGGIGRGGFGGIGGGIGGIGGGTRNSGGGFGSSRR